MGREEDINVIISVYLSLQNNVLAFLVFLKVTDEIFSILLLSQGFKM